MKYFYAPAEKDHPRRCGENYSENIENVVNKGITPAGAGKTKRVIQPRKRTEDHPRRCGENSGAELRRFFARGSPPQVRGKQPLSVL